MEETIGLGDAIPANGADTTTATTTKVRRGSVTSDPQLVACIKITKTLDGLTPQHRAFVLDYLAKKY